MNPVLTGLTVGALTTVARIASGKGMTIDIVVGVIGITIVLAALEQANEELAKAFGALVVVAVLFVHGPTIVRKAKVGSPKTTGRKVLPE